MPVLGAQQTSTVVSKRQPARWPAGSAKAPDQDREFAARRPARAGVVTPLPGPSRVNTNSTAASANAIRDTSSPCIDPHARIRIGQLLLEP